mmetsp:Transcript_1352/g.4062  ORF Transcript_1352/g.4062 Transcript_1352/m.4062 type:complete len:157 (-) Transcript_1352:36-506(-)
MRAVVQRVAQASVSGGGKTESIERGLCVLVGITSNDTNSDLDIIVKKLLNLKLFPDGDGDGKGSAWKKSVAEIQGDVLFVSQFTLHAVYKGNKPSFHRSMAPTDAEKMFYNLVERFKTDHSPDNVKACVFGSYMNVSLVNDGPVTVILDSEQPKGG